MRNLRIAALVVLTATVFTGSTANAQTSPALCPTCCEMRVIQRTQEAGSYIVGDKMVDGD